MTSTATPRSRAAQPSPGPTPTRSRALDGMRGWVVCLVVVFHAWQYAGGQADPRQDDPLSITIRVLQWPVVWFFVATGMLLYLSYARRVVHGRDPGGAVEFLGRRLLRVLPVYWVAILVIWSWRNVGANPVHLDDLFAHLTLTHVFSNELIFYTIGPAWSLTSQVAVYFVIALGWVPLRALARRFHGPNGRAFVLSLLPIAMIGIGVAYQFALVEGGVRGDDYAALFNPLAQFPALAFGMLVGLLVARHQPCIRSQFVTTLLVLASLVAVIPQGYLALAVAPSPAVTLLINGVSGVSASVVIASVMVTAPTTWWHRFLSAGPAAFIGVIGFSIYLWHEPVLLAMEQYGVINKESPVWWVGIVLFTTAMIAGWIMYHVVEVPLIHLGDLIRPKVGFDDRYLAGRVGDVLPIDASDGLVDRTSVEAVDTANRPRFPRSSS